MFAAMCCLGVCIIICGSHWIGWVDIGYFLGGVAVGTYESNMLSCVTPLGHTTKTWVILGMPVGFTMISVGGFVLMACGIDLVVLYLMVMAFCVAGIFLMSTHIPDIELPNNSKNLLEFIENARRFKLWMPELPWHSSALMFDMFSVSMLNGKYNFMFRVSNSTFNRIS